MRALLEKSKNVIFRALAALRLYRLAACVTHLEYLYYAVSAKAVAYCAAACARELACQVVDPFSRRRECPVCGWTGYEFSPNFYSDVFRPAARCPRCNCTERHRLLLWQLQSDPGAAPIHDLLAIGANPAFVRKLGAERWSIVDILPRPYVNYVADINKGLPFGDASFDAALCFRVLEHIPDDRAVLREIRRVLTPRAVVFLSVPLYEGLEETTEYADREHCRRGPLFRYGDHKRDYSISDLEQRIRDAGLEFERLQHSAATAPLPRWKTWADNDSAGKRMGLTCVDIVYVCRPARKED